MVIDLKKSFPAGALLAGLGACPPKKKIFVGAVWRHLIPFCSYDCKRNNPVFMRFLREKWQNLWSSIWKNISFQQSHC